MTAPNLNPESLAEINDLCAQIDRLEEKIAEVEKLIDDVKRLMDEYPNAWILTRTLQSFEKYREELRKELEDL